MKHDLHLCSEAGIFVLAGEIGIKQIVNESKGCDLKKLKELAGFSQILLLDWEFGGEIWIRVLVDEQPPCDILAEMSNEKFHVLFNLNISGSDVYSAGLDYIAPLNSNLKIRSQSLSDASQQFQFMEGSMRGILIKNKDRKTSLPWIEHLKGWGEALQNLILLTRFICLAFLGVMMFFLLLINGTGNGGSYTAASLFKQLSWLFWFGIPIVLALIIPRRKSLVKFKVTSDQYEPDCYLIIKSSSPQN